MNKFLIGILVLVLIIGGYVMSFYNSLVTMDEGLKSSKAQINNMYERRVDLIPQIAATVKKYVEYEKSTLTDIVKLRESSENLEKLTSLIEKGDISTDNFTALLSSTLSQIKVTMEAYPQLKGDTQFSSLISQLEGSENRIRVAIMDYNNLLISYNSKVRGFPGNFLAKSFGFAELDRINPPEDKDIKAVPDMDKLLDTTK